MAISPLISYYNSISSEYSEGVLFNDRPLHILASGDIASGYFYGSESAISMISTSGSIDLSHPGGLGAPLITLVAKDRIIPGTSPRGESKIPQRVIVGNLLSLTAHEIVIGDVGLMCRSDTAKVSLTAKRIVFLNPHDEETTIIEYLRKCIIFDDTKVEVVKFRDSE